MVYRIALRTDETIPKVPTLQVQEPSACSPHSGPESDFIKWVTSLSCARMKHFQSPYLTGPGAKVLLSTLGIQKWLYKMVDQFALRKDETLQKSQLYRSEGQVLALRTRDPKVTFIK